MNLGTQGEQGEQGNQGEQGEQGNQVPQVSTPCGELNAELCMRLTIDGVQSMVQLSWNPTDSVWRGFSGDFIFTVRCVDVVTGFKMTVDTSVPVPLENGIPTVIILQPTLYDITSGTGTLPTWNPNPPYIVVNPPQFSYEFVNCAG